MPQLLESIYPVRNKLDRKRQPTFAPDLDELDRLMKMKGKNNPYEQYEEEYKTIPTYRNGGAGVMAHIGKKEYLYRIHSLESIIRDLGAGLDVKDLFNKIKEESSNAPGNWLNLEKLTDIPNLESKRNFNFWTCSCIEPTTDSIIDNSLKSGLPTTYVVQYSLLMRLRVGSIDSGIVRVPSVIDGFCNSVFCPVDYTKSPVSGMALNLKDNPLTYGNAEYSLICPPVNTIELIPIEITKDMKMQLPILASPLLQMLLEKYETELNT